MPPTIALPTTSSTCRRSARRWAWTVVRGHSTSAASSAARRPAGARPAQQARLRRRRHRPTSATRRRGAVASRPSQAAAVPPQMRARAAASTSSSSSRSSTQPMRSAICAPLHGRKQSLPNCSELGAEHLERAAERFAAIGRRRPERDVEAEHRIVGRRRRGCGRSGRPRSPRRPRASRDGRA